MGNFAENLYLGKRIRPPLEGHMAPIWHTTQEITKFNNGSIFGVNSNLYWLMFSICRFNEIYQVKISTVI